MKALVFIGTFGVVCLSVFLLFKDNGYRITNYPPQIDGPIVAFGDSLVEGVGAEPTQNFVSRLSSKINEPIINLGVSGNTTQDGLERIDDALKENPRIVIVLLGGNDYLKRISKEETFRNLRLIISQIQANNAIVVLLGVRGGVLQDHYDNEYKALARETGSVYVEDVLDGLITKPQLMSDGIHPNALGYEHIATKVYKKIIDIL